MTPCMSQKSRPLVIDVLLSVSMGKGVTCVYYSPWTVPIILARHFLTYSHFGWKDYLLLTVALIITHVIQTLLIFYVQYFMISARTS